MFFNTIQTLIEHHNFKSANIQVAIDKNGLYAIVNLAVNEEKVDEAMQQACATPFVVRDTGEGFDLSAETIIESLYQTIVSVDALDASKFAEVIKNSNSKTKAATVKTSATKPTESAPKPTPTPTPTPSTTSASSVFGDSDEL